MGVDLVSDLDLDLDRGTFLATTAGEGVFDRERGGAGGSAAEAPRERERVAREVMGGR